MNKLPVAEIVRRAVAASTRSLNEIARSVGFESPDALSTIGSGSARIPLDVAPSLADALGLNRIEFVTACLCEYEPALFEVLDDVYGLHHCAHERQLLEALRNQTGHPYLAALSERSKAKLADFLQQLRDESAVATIH